MTQVKVLGTIAIVALGLGFASSASAAPLSPVPAGILQDAAVERVAYGCGPGWAPNRWGECRPMYRRYGYGRYYGPYYGHRGYYARPVFHVGPFGAGVSFR
ncbi:GCG_CRPN prefix-to-repeats domain-containing protein [Methylobacterium iners]|uniref:Uncharacterized protein n=1 Tax=Methylobacterium iners TaxID=418707 RepID=A0ABQ4S5S9_9HYPH|nr:hypothetical protein [Methylobacterium iners]GJD97915.1 hypothetical protein OCOJLMKI_5154 [Methylobacterium iners]